MNIFPFYFSNIYLTLNFFKNYFLAKDSRLQDQRQNSPAGNKENMKPNETSPSFSKVENKGESFKKSLGKTVEIERNMSNLMPNIEYFCSTLFLSIVHI